jgi:NAD(P)-dependent dehydrogenase (short-subunit alcohol dehydrogenase family)
MNRLKDKVAVITGSGQGMGEGIARLFASEGAKVVISNRNQETGKAVTASINEEGGEAIYQRADVAVESECRVLIDRAVDHFGKIDVLVNNVGWSARGNIEDTSVEMWDTVFAINVRSAFICAQQAVRYMKEKQRGSIVNIGSVNSYIGESKLMAYSASKGALMTLTKNLASYLNRYRIRVNQLNVGWTLTPNEHVVKTEVERKGEDWLEQAVKTRPWGRLLTPHDIALAAIYFASDESECINGSVLDLEQYPVGGPSDK